MTQKIAGYRELTLDEQLRINTIKMTGTELLEYFELLSTEPGHDVRWLAIAKTHLQQACMAAVRAIAQPSGV